MIEVEKRFVDLTDDSIAALTSGGEFVQDKTNVDVYYDDDGYSLALSDRWLRSRNGRFELKIPVVVGSKTSQTQVYHELETDEEIYKALEIERTTSLEADLAKAGINAFMTARTSRSAYRNREFNIDIDNTIFDGQEFTYSGADIEIMVESEDGIAAATEQILAFARECGLDVDSNPLGKIGTFLKNTKSHQYEVLVENGILPRA